MDGIDVVCDFSRETFDCPLGKQSNLGEWISSRRDFVIRKNKKNNTITSMKIGLTSHFDVLK